MSSLMVFLYLMILCWVIAYVLETYCEDLIIAYEEWAEKEFFVIKNKYLLLIVMWIISFYLELNRPRYVRGGER